MVSHDLGLVSTKLKRVACVGRTISIHSARELPPERLAELYGGDMAVVDHSHDVAADEPDGPRGGSAR